VTADACVRASAQWLLTNDTPGAVPAGRISQARPQLDRSRRSLFKNLKSVPEIDVDQYFFPSMGLFFKVTACLRSMCLTPPSAVGSRTSPKVSHGQNYSDRACGPHPTSYRRGFGRGRMHRGTSQNRCRLNQSVPCLRPRRRSQSQQHLSIRRCCGA